MIKQIDSTAWFRLNGISRYVLAHFGSAIFPFYIVNEYPKSGGTWIGSMLSDSLGVPFPRNRLPVLRPSILHGHMMHSWGMKNVLIVWRDGRDVLVSQYYHSLFKNEHGNQRLVELVRSELNFQDYENIKKNLPAFIDYTYINPQYPRMSWADFVRRWWECEACVHTKYEVMREAPVDELRRITLLLARKELSLPFAEDIVQKNSFTNKSGRSPGEENKSSFLRKGIVGDWKNHFSHEACIRFDQLAGDALIQLGYESDHGWVNNCV